MYRTKKSAGIESVAICQGNELAGALWITFQPEAVADEPAAPLHVCAIILNQELVELN
jgi:hypothetical protein